MNDLLTRPIGLFWPARPSCSSSSNWRDVSRFSNGFCLERTDWYYDPFAAVRVNPFVVALAFTAIALVGSFPLAFLFERAGFSIWPTVIPHVTVHLIQLVAIPEPCSMTVLLAWRGLQMVMPLLIWAFRKNLLKD